MSERHVKSASPKLLTFGTSLLILSTSLDPMCIGRKPVTDKKDIVLMAHLMRRAGFGATRDEVERRAANGYEATVEELVDPPSSVPRADHHLLFRYIPSTETEGQLHFRGRLSGSTT